MKKKDDWLNKKELAIVFDIREETVKKLAKDGELPCKYVNQEPQFRFDVIVKHFEKIEGGVA